MDSLLYLFSNVGSPRILEICGQSIMKRLSVIDRIPSDWFQHETKSASLLEGLPHSDLLSSLATLQNHIFVCDPGIFLQF